MVIINVFKKWWFWVFVLLILGVGYYFINKNDEVTYLTEIINLTTLEQTVDVGGEVESINEVELAFDIGGELSDVFVSVGDIVEIGTLLASLDVTGLNADIQSAYQAIQIAKANLEKKRAGSDDETIAVSEASVKTAQALLNKTIIDLQNTKSLLDVTRDKFQQDISLKNIQAQASKDDLSQANIEFNLHIKDAYRDLLSSSWASIVYARSGLTQSDDVIGVRNGVANDDFQFGLSVRDTESLNNAKNSFMTAEIGVNEAEVGILNLNYASSYLDIYNIAVLVQDAVYDVAKLLLHTQLVIDSSLTGNNFTVSDHAVIKSNVKSSRVALQSSQSALENSFQLLESVLNEKVSGVRDLENTLLQSNISLDASKALSNEQLLIAENNIVSLSESVLIKEAELSKTIAVLNQTKAIPQHIDLASYKAEVQRAIAAHSARMAALDRAKIVTPIKGRVTALNMEIGETVVATTPLVTVQTTDAQFKVVANISESDIIKINLNDPVSLTFDAFSQDVVLHGRVGEIDPAEHIIEGVVYYEATIFLDNSNVSMLRPGLSTDLIIKTEMRENSISIPQRSVFKVDGSKYVRVLVDGQPKDVYIETGLRGDMGRIEVIDGLVEGDELILKEINE